MSIGSSLGAISCQVLLVVTMDRCIVLPSNEAIVFKILSSCSAPKMADDPTSVVSQEMGDVADVGNSTAILSIDSLLDEGKLVEDRGTHLKNKFKELHDRVLQIWNHDNFLLKRARQCRKELEAEKAKVDKCGEVARGDDAVIQQLKKDLAAAEHELSVAQEKESMLQVEALELDRKKQNLTHEVEDAIAAEEARLKPQIESLHADIREIGKETEKTAEEFDRLKEERERIMAKEQAIRDDMVRLDNVIHEANLEKNRIDREPERAKKQADIVVKAVQNTNKELTTLEDKVSAQNNALQELENKKTQLSQRGSDLLQTLHTNKADIESKMKTFESFKTNLDEDQKNHDHLKDRVSTLDRMLQEAAVAMNVERDNHARTLRDKDNGMKNFKRIDQEKSDLASEKEILLKQREVLRREQHRLEEVRRVSEENLADLKRDVDILINSFLKEEISEKRCVADKEAMQSFIKGLEDDVSRLTLTEQRQKREASELAIKREQMSRDCSRNYGRVLIAKNELKVKEVVVRELTKRSEELKNRLGGLMEMYSTVKRERSQKAAAIQSASQTMSETQEKIKILENELEVLRRESLIKDQELSKKRRDSHEMRQTCKNLRVEKNKLKKKLEAAINQENDLRNQMGKLNSVISHTEDEMLALKKSYEDAVENRNYTGIQLIDRNDELCILYEKANIQEDILKRGMVMLNLRTEEIRKTAIELADLQREIEICQRVLPEVRDLEEDLAQLMQDHQDEKWRAEVLEKDLTDPNNKARWRKLDTVKAKPEGSLKDSKKADGSPTKKEGGASEHQAELIKKQEDLERRVAAINERLMEKDLILEEVTELSNKLRQQAMSGRDFTLALAKRVNNYQFGLKSKTKKMMATLSELSMVQASSLQLGAQLASAEESLKIAQARMEDGLPPSDEVVRRMEKEERDSLRRSQILQQRKEKSMKEADATTLRTTAEQRPNAYIPDSELGLPKPYGSHPPFKPTLSTQNNVSRFYRAAPAKELSFDDDE